VGGEYRPAVLRGVPSKMFENGIWVQNVAIRGLAEDHILKLFCPVKYAILLDFLAVFGAVLG